MSHTHRRIQYATAPGILCVDVDRFDPVTGEHVPFDASSGGGWDIYFRMWRYVKPGRCGDETVIVADAEASQPAVRQLLYMPAADAVAVAGEYRGVFTAVRVSDGARDLWPVQIIVIDPVAGGEFAP